METSDCGAVYGPTNPSPETQTKSDVQRFGSVIGLNANSEKYYRELHADVWQHILDRIKGSNIRNYSIFVSEIEGKKYLFSYFEYLGDDFDADMKAMADDPEMQCWWKETDPCQFQLPTRKTGANWSEMEMVFLAE